MRTKRAFYSLSVLLVVVWMAMSANAQNDTKYRAIAVKLVNSASIKPGDNVVINGGTHMVPLMEAVAIEVQKAGGFANMWLNSDKVSRSQYTEVPDKYLEMEPRYFADWLKHTDVYISLPATEDAKALNAGISEEKFAKISKASDFFSEILNTLPLRIVSLDFPTKTDAANNGMDFDAYQKIVMAGIQADYNKISEQGSKLKQMLQSGKEVHITNAAGTDLTFRNDSSRKILLDDGLVTAEEAKSPLFIDRLASLPAGTIAYAPVETSANGKVVLPKAGCHFEPMNNVTFGFKDGQMVDFQAGSNASCYQNIMKAYGGNKERFGSVNIGLNPGIKAVEEGSAHYRPGNAAGLVYISVGDNRFYGGTNTNIGGYSFAITNATVTIDGKIVIKDGKLIL